MSLRKGDIMSNIFYFISKEPVMHHNEVGKWVESGVLQRVLGQVDLGCETFPITNGPIMAVKVLKVMKKNEVDAKIMGYTFDGGSNLQTMADATDAVCGCAVLGGKRPSRNDCTMH